MDEVKLPPAPWSVDPDDRDGMDWNMHVLDAKGDRICFMANRDGYALASAAAAIAAVPTMLEALKGYERWEADLILRNTWNGKDGMPTLTAEEYDELMRLQALRNAALRAAERP